MALAVSLLSGVHLPLAAQPTSVTDAPTEVVIRALTLVDAPYRYGGRTPAGFDCSGFVGYVFSETAGLELPRRAEDLSRAGVPLARDDLAPGDLVFFNTLGRRFSHVGIYLGDGKFVHAPARRGRVRVDALADDYWNSRYNGARRIGAVSLASAQVSAAASTTAAEGAAELRITP